jgi:hypothetical protein
MADKTLHEYSIPTIANVPVEPAVNMGNTNFEVEDQPNHGDAGKSILWIA